MSEPIVAAAVVVPARDEQDVLDACLRSIADAGRAARSTGVAVHTVVVANRCADATAEVARGHDVHVLVNDAVNVGRARADGCAWAAAVTRQVDPRLVWFATTDADSVVPERWLVAQLEHARAGAEAFAGTIMLDEVDAARHRVWTSDYRRAALRTPHGHVHGANLGVRADAYRRAGGFAPVDSGEDSLLVAALLRDRVRIAWVDDTPVTTSARHLARAPAGVGRDLRASI